MALATSLFSATPALAEERTFKIVATTDVHGNFFPYDFIKLEPAYGSLARVASRVNFLRDAFGKERVILLDNGDILQGQPTAYYYNFIDTVSPHIAAIMLDFMGYDAETVGNHDIETGHAVYDRYRENLGDIPLLAANVTDTSNGMPYFKPYTIVNRDGIKIVILGMITPAIPAWLPENLWSGLRFEDMVESASYWVPLIIEKEKPDLLVGLFHSGHDSSRMTGEWRENASLLVAEQVPGFDIIFIGHDHIVYNSGMSNNGTDVLVLNSANNAINTAEAEVTFTIRDGKVTDKKISGSVVSVSNLEPDSAFMAEFKSDHDTILDFVTRRIGRAEGDFSVRDAYFGPSAFMQLLHELQLSIADADISFAAPLSYDALISEGDLRMSDMFTLYKYENMLYTMALSGLEIKNYLEMSYSLWTDVMDSPDSHLLLFSDGGNGAAKGDYAKLRNPSYNFDSAFGIIYTVDVTKPCGGKIDIKSMADGSPFHLDKVYKVAVNSYRGNGGGDLLTKGAGISHEELKSRIIRSTDKDLRFYLIKEIEKKSSISPEVNPNWSFVPVDMTRPAAARDRKILFGE